MAEQPHVPEIKVIATNRAARHNYVLSDTFEAGIVLRGSEVKALRESKVQIVDAFAQLSGGELWLHNLHVAPYSFSQSYSGHDPLRVRKLLLNRRELEKIRRKQLSDRLNIVPLRIYFKDGKAKVEIALAKGKTKGDRRQDIAKRDADRDARNAMGRALKYGG
ncbi:MAG TPA: SsrA-binding protein SmpB [Microthrixaceae bacterium]|nr:SsrA-binding protein SmpB [Microthrixaceae bacterium]HNI36364.1 SsrA-binding protein SmpB [Microthrixaceae bacterium]